MRRKHYTFNLARIMAETLGLKLEVTNKLETRPSPRGGLCPYRLGNLKKQNGETILELEPPWVIIKKVEQIEKERRRAPQKNPPPDNDAQKAILQANLKIMTTLQVIETHLSRLVALWEGEQ